MSDWSNAPEHAAADGQSEQRAGKSHPVVDEPGFVDGIPVEDLVRMTREFTARITNEDRQRLALELNESGHQRSIQSSAPFLLQQFFTGKIDLDVELSRRYPSAPLLSSASFTPEPGKQAKHGFAMFSSQDNSAALSIEIHGPSGALNISFLLQSMIGIRFVLGATTELHRKRFVELMRRPDGIAFLWTRERWERDYLIFVVRERYARIHAFGPNRFDAACRLTPDGLDQLMEWLGGLWVVGAEPEAPDVQDATPTPFSW